MTLRPVADETRIDPIGIELVLTIFGTVVSIVSTAHQFGLIKGRDKRVQDNFKRLREEVFRLGHCVDELALTMQRHIGTLALDSPDRSLPDNPATLSGTVMLLQHREYRRWRDLQEKVHKISRDVYDLCADIREAMTVIGESEEAAAVGADILEPFDEVMLSFGTRPFGEVLQKLREAVRSLEHIVNGVLRRHSGS